MHPRLSVALLAALALAPAALVAQDPFEIQVYEYETVPAGRWNLETHLNYVAKGSTQAEGEVAPSNHQGHLTFELTHGITDAFEFAGYLVLASRPGEGAEFAGWRLRPRIRAPEGWNLPVGLSLAAEVGFPQDAYEADDVTLEIRPVIEKRIGRLQVDLNPVVGRSLKGPGTEEGWDFEPGARVGLTLTPMLDLSVEYYASLGKVFDWSPKDAQVHQFFFGGDIALSEDVVWNLGVGVAATDIGNQKVLKTRLGWMF